MSFVNVTHLLRVDEDDWADSAIEGGGGGDKTPFSMPMPDFRLRFVCCDALRRHFARKRLANSSDKRRHQFDKRRTEAARKIRGNNRALRRQRALGPNFDRVKQPARLFTRQRANDRTFGGNRV